MSFANRYNQGNKFDVDTTGFEYKKLSSLLPDFEYQLCGLFINTKGEYGPNPVAILSDCFVSLPQHLIPAVKDMLLDEETVQDIKGGKCGFKVRKYTDKKGTDRLSVTWCDM